MGTEYFDWEALRLLLAIAFGYCVCAYMLGCFVNGPRDPKD